MARVYANIFCAIWDDAEFCALSSDAQRTYFMLVTQKEITACGSLPLTLRRWSLMLPEKDRPTLAPALDELAEHRFILTDEDTEELLVRTFPKHDGGYKHSKRVLAVIAYAEAIRSQSLRNTVAVELDKLGVKTAIQLPTDSQSVANQEATDSRRSVVTEVSTNHTPQTTNLNPQTATPAPVAIATRAELALVSDKPTVQTIVGEWLERTPKRPPARVIGPVSQAVRAMLAEGIDADDIRRGIHAWMTKGLHPSTLPSVVNEVMNAGPRQQRGQQETDAMFERAAERMGIKR